jgi:hypothetical protein
MGGFWGSVVSGCIAGVAAAVVWAGIAWSINFVRSWQITRMMSHSLSESAKGVTFNHDGGMGFGIENTTKYSVVIRRVALIGGTKMSSTILLGLDESAYGGTSGTTPGVRKNGFGWVELPPFTKGVWVFHTRAGAVPPRFLPLTDISITCEVKTLFGTTKIITVHPPEGHRDYMVKAFSDRAAGNFPIPTTTGNI